MKAEPVGPESDGLFACVDLDFSYDRDSERDHQDDRRVEPAVECQFAFHWMSLRLVFFGSTPFRSLNGLEPEPAER